MLDVVATLAMIGTAAAVAWSVLVRPTAAVPVRAAIPLPTAPLALDDLPMLGASEASVVMMIFSDFECPYCGGFAAEIMPAIKQKYVDTGKVRMTFRHLPLSIHMRARRAAESAECARRQGSFWAMHDLLFQVPMRLDERDLEANARTAGLDPVGFAACMAGGAEERVAADAALAQELGLGGTPSFIIGRTDETGSLRAIEVMTGARPIGDFADALDRALTNEGR